MRTKEQKIAEIEKLIIEGNILSGTCRSCKNGQFKDWVNSVKLIFLDEANYIKVFEDVNFGEEEELVASILPEQIPSELNESITDGILRTIHLLEKLKSELSAN